MRILIAALMLGMAVTTAEAQVNRCMIDGVTTWQSAPCPAGTDTDRITTQGPQADEQEWYVGGDLHRSTIAEWRQASPRNKLATAADWVTALKLADNFRDTRPLAEELVTCIDGSIAGHDVGFLETREIGAACATLMHPR